MNDQIDPPLIVNRNALPAVAAVVLRYALQALGGFLVARGWIGESVSETLVSGGLVVAPMAYAAWKAQRNRAKLVTVAIAAPDTVAVIK